MLVVQRLRQIGCKLSMLRPRSRPSHSPLRLAASSAADRQNVFTDTRAVIFDMGGVLIPSPLPFLTGKHCHAVISVVSYRTDSTGFYSAQRLDLFAWCVSLSQL